MDGNAFNRMFEHLLKEPSNPKWYGKIGVSLCEAGELKWAENYLQYVLQLAPADSEGWRQYAMILHLRSKWSESAAAWQSYLQLKPNDSTALETLADCCYLAGDYHEAATYFSCLKHLGKEDDSIGQ